jgi:hypothetical protein
MLRKSQYGMGQNQNIRTFIKISLLHDRVFGSIAHQACFSFYRSMIIIQHSPV